MTESKVERNKRLKKEKLEESGYELFMNNTFDKTSIDQIVKKAGVAKGTFYLYFEDKKQLLNRVIMKKSGDILMEALTQANYLQLDNKLDQFIVMVDCILDYFKENQNILEVVRNHLSWDNILQDLGNNQNYSIQVMMKEYVELIMTNKNYTQKEAIQTIYVIFELVSSVAYASIIVKKPFEVNEIKPMLYASIRSMIRSNS